MTLVDSLRHVIAHKDSLLEAAATRSVHINVPPQHLTVSLPPSWLPLIYVLVGGGLSILGGLWAQAYRAKLEDRRAYRHLKTVLVDEVFALAMRCGMWSKFIQDTSRVTDFHIHQLQVRMEIYDRSIERLALMPLEVRRAVASWYQDLKGAVWFAGGLEKTQTFRLENEGRQDVVIKDLEEDRVELVNRLDRLAEAGDLLFKQLQATSDTPA